MSELTLIGLIPGATQTADEVTIPKAAFHPSFTAAADNTGESIWAGLIWQVHESGVLSESALEENAERNVAIVEDDPRIETDLDTGQQYLYRSLQITFREPYSPQTFNASLY